MDGFRTSAGRLRDAHLHLAAHGEELSGVALRDCASVGACLERIAARAGEVGEAQWIVARGARIEAWDERRYPSAGELDEAGGGRPVVVASFDHHAASASSAALRSAGLLEGGTVPGGVVERDGAGRATGVVLEGAFKALLRAMPHPDEAQSREHVLAAQADLRSLGIVDVHDMMTSGADARLFIEMDRAGEIDLDVLCYATGDHFDEVRRALGGHEGRVRFGGMKLFMDGTLNSRTAHMLEAYADPMPEHPCGTPLMSRAEVDDVFRRAALEGFAVAAHAIGDAAVRTLLDAYEAAGGASAGFGLRIEHAQFVDEADVERFAAMGVVTSLQACHLLTDVEAIGRLVPHRAERSFPLRDLCEAASASGRSPADLVWLGSDTPVVPPDPRDNAQAAVHRRRAEAGCPVVGGSQAIDEALAWSLLRSPLA